MLTGNAKQEGKCAPVETGLTRLAAMTLVNPMFHILGGNLASIHLFIKLFLVYPFDNNK